MRWLYLTLVSILAVATLIFAMQNLEIDSIDFLSFSARTPLAFLVVAAYLIGMATGESFLALIRRSVKGAWISGTGEGWLGGLLGHRTQPWRQWGSGFVCVRTASVKPRSWIVPVRRNRSGG